MPVFGQEDTAMIHVVITGCSRGLGLALASTFIARGCRVSATVRTEESARQLRRRFAAPHRVAAVDATDAAALDAFARETAAIDPPTIVIANAGVINERQPLWQTPVAEWNEVIAVNLTGPFLLAKAFMPRMADGTFIAISSGWGRSAGSGVGPYCASKFGVEGMIGSLSADLQKAGSQVRAIALDPGVINTDMLARCLPEENGLFPGADAWAPGAAAYILDHLHARRLSGPQAVPA
jgi:NAD(P)-dependent dehydrogenase (short-subunit alcohol dehydrogenase family)